MGYLVALDMTAGCWKWKEITAEFHLWPLIQIKNAMKVEITVPEIMEFFNEIQNKP